MNFVVDLCLMLMTEVSLFDICEQLLSEKPKIRIDGLLCWGKMLPTIIGMLN